MKRIRLGGTRGYTVVVDDCDFEALSGYSWTPVVQGRAPNLRVYAQRQEQLNGRTKWTRMHRQIWEMANGPIPNGAEIDHREPGEFAGLDNRRSNLRLTTKSLNQANSRKGRNNTSGFKGVWFQRQARRWHADIWVNRKKSHLGYFDSKEAAARAYDAAALAAFGEHARLNFPAEAA